MERKAQKAQRYKGLPKSSEKEFYAKNKYHNRRVTVCGEKFDSKKEAERWLVLREMQRRGEILGLARQQRYELIPAQYRNGECVERAVFYYADFCYVKDGELVVEDTKGFRTDVYKIKRKLMLERYNIRIKEM